MASESTRLVSGQPSAVTINTSTDGLNPMETAGYSQDFCQCYTNPVLCLAAFCCSQCLLGYVVGVLDGRGFNVVACCCAGISLYRLRRDVQSRFGINESHDASTCAAGFCPCCTLVQDVAELEKKSAISSIFGNAVTITVQPGSQ